MTDPIAPGRIDATIASPDSTRGEIGTLAHESGESRQRFRPLPGSPRYRVIRFHAKGGLGQVSVAEDLELPREVAYKEIQPAFADQESAQDRFVREAHITGRLEHPGIVPVYGLGVGPEGRPYYAMRFIQGENLGAAIERFHTKENAKASAGERALQLRNLLKRFTDACNAIAFAHDRRVIHCDIKPANIMLGTFGETLVVDWGLAREIYSAPPIAAPQNADSEATHGLIGTPAYMPPEQAAGRQADLGPASDIYSLGATLYHILTGRAPYSGPVREVIERVQKGDAAEPRTVNRQVPRPLQAICVKAMALQPGGRYAGALDLARDVDHWLADERVSAYREAWHERARRWVRRHRTLATSAGALIAALAVFFAVLALVINRDRQRISLEKENTENARQAAVAAQRRTRDALDMMSDKVIERWLTKEMMLTDDQRGLLEKAVASYEQFAQETGDDPETILGVAKAHLRIGMIRGRLGQTNAAQAAFLRSRELFQAHGSDDAHLHAGICLLNLGLVAQDAAKTPEAIQYLESAMRELETASMADPRAFQPRMVLAKVQSTLALQYRLTGKAHLGEPLARRVIEALEKLKEKAPETAELDAIIAANWVLLGTIRYQSAQFEESEKEYRTAIEVYRRLAADQPGVPNHRLDQARVLNNLAAVKQSQKLFAEADQFYFEAQRLRQELVEEFPGVLQYREQLVRGWANLASNRVQNRKFAEAEPFLKDAITESRRLLLHSKNNAAHQSLLSQCLNLQAAAVASRDKTAALAHAEEACTLIAAALKTSKDNPNFLLQERNAWGTRIEILVSMNDYARVLPAVDALLACRHDPANNAYLSARYLVHCAVLVERDTKLDEAQRRKTANEYAAQAVKYVRLAAERGFTNVAQLRRDTLLKQLAADPEFQKILAEMDGQPAKP